MAYNPYGGNPYGAPPVYNPYPGAGRGIHPGYGPPPGMSPAPGMAPPPGVQQPPSATQANRPSGLPPSFHPPANINFNAPVIRLGGAGASLPARPNAPTAPGRRDPETPLSAGGPMRADFRHGRDGGLDQNSRGTAGRDTINALIPPSNDEKLRTIFVHRVPASVGDQALEKLMRTVGRLRRWDAEVSHLSDHEGELFGFAQYEDADSLASAIELLKDVEVPLKKQEPKEAPANGAESVNSATDDSSALAHGQETDAGDAIEKVALQVVVDPVSLQYLEAHAEKQSEEAAAEAKARREANKAALKAAIHDLFHPTRSDARDGDGDVKMTDAGALGDGVEVLNIPIAQDDELADIPAEMREIVASEIASFRDRSNQRDLERLKREQEMEELERRRNGEAEHSRGGRGDAQAPSSSNNIPLGPRGSTANNSNSAALARGVIKGVGFVNGGTANGGRDYEREDSPDTDASDEEIYRRDMKKQAADDESLYKEAERKWVNRERQRAAALGREKERDRADADNAVRHKEEALERERTWDDEREASHKSHLYYRDHAAWLRKRAHERAEEEARDAADRRAERDEQRRQASETEAARGMADAFLAEQAQQMELAEELRVEERRVAAAAEAAATVTATAATAAAAVPQRVTISFGAAAQRAQAQRAGGTRRTVADVEGLLDDEEQEATTKRQLVPIKFEPMAASASMTDAEINQAVRGLAQEIPTERAGLWAWEVQWRFLDDAMIRDKLRPFVEKKVVEYLGVQEQFLVEVVEEHLRQHSKPEALVEELQEALDEAAEDLVKKLWRMVIFFTESEKRGLPA